MSGLDNLVRDGLDLSAGNDEPVPLLVIRLRAQELVAQAKQAGVVLTIEQEPLLPLAMGHYETVVSVRPARGAA